MQGVSMRRMRVGLLAGLALLLTLGEQRVRGETQVYKSTDAKGQVTYGDKPAAGAVSVEDMGVTTPDPETSPAEQQKRIANIAETANRLRDDRLQREKARADARSPASQAPPAIPYYVPVPTGYAPEFLGYPGYNRYPHPHRGVPFNIDIHGGGRDFRYDASLGRHQPRGPGLDDMDGYPSRAPDQTRAPYREPSLLRNLRR